MLKQKPETFIIDGNWESSRLITWLGENAQNSLAEMHLMTDDAEDKLIFLEKLCSGPIKSTISWSSWL